MSACEAGLVAHCPVPAVMKLELICESCGAFRSAAACQGHADAITRFADAWAFYRPREAGLFCPQCDDRTKLTRVPL